MNGHARNKLRILILDDHAAARRGLTQILAEKFDQLEFDEGEAGLKSLDTVLGQPWDLVIVAIDLPDREGLALLTELKRRRPEQPILILTLRVGDFAVASTPDEMISAVRRLVAIGRIGRASGM